MIRVEVRDRPPLTLSQQGGEAGGSLTGEAPGRVGAALTKPGCASTARWRRPGERGGEEYARNQRYYVLSEAASPHPAADLAEVVRIYGIRHWTEQGYKQVNACALNCGSVPLWFLE